MYSLPSHRPPTNSLPLRDDRDVFSQEEETVNLRDYLIIIRKYRWTILAFLLPVVLLTGLSGLGKAPVYSATVILYLERQTPNIVGVPETISLAGNVPDYYLTQVNLLRSRGLAARVIQELGLDRNRRFPKYMDPPSSILQRQMRAVHRSAQPMTTWFSEQSPVQWLLMRFNADDNEKKDETGAVQTFEFGVNPGLIDRYLSGLSVSQVVGTQLIRVSFSSLNPALSKEAVNAHATAFISTSLLTRFELTAEARQFLQGKLSELKAKLEQSEEDLNRFRKAHAIVALEKGGENLVMDRLNGLNKDLTLARSKRIELESLYRVIQQKDNRFLTQIIDNSVVHALKDQIFKLEQDKTNLATVYRPTFPGVSALQEQIVQAQDRLNQEILRIVRSITADYNAAKAREKALADEMEQARQEALDLREKAIEASMLERDVESNRVLYENVLKKTKETDLTGSVPISNIRVVDAADIPRLSDDGRGQRILLLGVLVGLLGGVGIAFLRHYLDNTLKTPEDIAHVLHLPTLGLVPDIGRLMTGANGLGSPKKRSLPLSLFQSRRGRNSEIAISHHPLSLVGESYRTICTGLLFSLPERPPRTILITSSQPKEGKTVTAINLAVSLARNGAPVLLIDADLRNGQCHRLLGVQRRRGLADVLTGNGSAAEFLQETAVQNLSLLSCGYLPPNPAELLGSQKMRQLLESLEPGFPFIILDSAPLLPITDSVLLSTKVDGVLLIVKSQAVSRYVVRQACERLTYARATIIGVVLNHIDIHSPDYKDYRSSYTSYYTAYAADNTETRGGEAG
jgi:polysaccharide biosynthesis transport protein